MEITPAAAAYAARELQRRPELNHTLTVEAFLVAGCCSPNLPPEVRLGPPPGGEFRAVTVPLAGPAVAGAAGAATATGSAAEAGSPAVEVYLDPLVEDFVRDWYGEAGREQAERAVLRIDLVRYGDREELTVRPWPPRPAPAPTG
ncbi:MAG TPA: hypothetical protein VIL40_04520 [Thermaerobacter sp.]